MIELKWISIKEKMPPNCTIVTLYKDDETEDSMLNPYSGMYHPTSERWFENNQYIPTPTHWFPIPENPKKVD
jgi:hypothetical protein